MNTKKHIFFDLDGTLLNSDHKVLKDTIEIIERLKEKGIGISLATGRSINMTIDYINQLKINDPVVLSNGGFILYPREKKIKVLSKKLDNLVINHIINFLKTYGGTINWISEKNDYAYSTSYTTERIKAYTPNFIDLSGKSINDLKEHLLNNNVYQLTIIYDHIDAVEGMSIHQVVDSFKELQDKQLCKVAHTTKIFIDVNNYKTDKLPSILHVVNDLGIDHNNVYYFGDSNNDIATLAYFKNSYAMKNGEDKAKEAASKVIGDHNSNTIAKTLLEIFY